MSMQSKFKSFETRSEDTNPLKLMLSSKISKSGLDACVNFQVCEKKKYVWRERVSRVRVSTWEAYLTWLAGFVSLMLRLYVLPIINKVCYRSF